MSIELTAVVLALIAMLANGEYFLGSSMLSRPLVTCTLAGLVMGDITQGVIIGATLELAFVGSFSIGASIPPEIISGSVLGTAFAIGAGKSTEIALTLGIPIAHYFDINREPIAIEYKFASNTKYVVDFT